MANRHLSRSVALQSLFEWDFNGEDSSIIREVVRRNAAEFAPGMDDLAFTYGLVEGVLGKRKKLDTIIEKFAPDWPLEHIAIVDRNVLRLGLYELLFTDRSEVPSKVAINEAIELAKTFGGESSGRFINGVLGSVYRELGEPGKDDVPEKKRRVKDDVDPATLPVETLGGAVIYHCERGQCLLALVHDVFGYWTLSKGHVEDGEDVRAATAREIKEEVSLDVHIDEELGTNEYVASHPERGKVRKRVTYFLARAEHPQALKLTKEGGLDRAEWFPLAQVAELRLYGDIIPIITKGIQHIVKQDRHA